MLSENIVNKCVVYLADTSKTGCGVPPINITDPRFFLFSACAEHDAAYIMVRRDLLCGLLTYPQAKLRIIEADRQFRSHGMFLAKQMSFIKQPFCILVVKIFSKIVDEFGYKIFVLNTERERLRLTTG